MFVAFPESVRQALGLSVDDGVQATAIVFDWAPPKGVISDALFIC